MPVLGTLRKSPLRLSAVAVVAADAEELSEKFAMKNCHEEFSEKLASLRDRPEEGVCQ